MLAAAEKYPLRSGGVDKRCYRHHCPNRASHNHAVGHRSHYQAALTIAGFIPQTPRSRLCFLPRSYIPHLSKMPAKLKASQLEQIQHVIESGSLIRAEIAFAAGCSKQAVIYICQNLEVFGNIRTPWNSIRCPRSIILIMLEAVLEGLKEKPTLYLDKLVVFIYDDFRKCITKQSLSRIFTSIN